jgi:hypothetical protein
MGSNTVDISKEQREDIILQSRFVNTPRMTLLDHFAGQAMQALITLNNGFPPHCGDDAYYIAQEMVVARAKVGLAE